MYWTLKCNHSYEVQSGGASLFLFMQITTFSTCKTKPNLQVKAKKTVCITSKLYQVYSSLGSVRGSMLECWADNMREIVAMLGWLTPLY